MSIGANGSGAATGSSPIAIKFAPKTGLFTGTFDDQGARRPFAGAILETGTFGLGLFQDASGQAGSVLLEGAP